MRTSGEKSSLNRNIDPFSVGPLDRTSSLSLKELNLAIMGLGGVPSARYIPSLCARSMVDGARVTPSLEWQNLIPFSSGSRHVSLGVSGML